MIENDMLIRETPVYEQHECVAIRKDLIITKEEFLECFNEWVVKPLQENPVSLQTDFFIPVNIPDDNGGVKPV